MYHGSVIVAVKSHPPVLAPVRCAACDPRGGVKVCLVRRGRFIPGARTPPRPCLTVPHTHPHASHCCKRVCIAGIAAPHLTLSCLRMLVDLMAAARLPSKWPPVIDILSGCGCTAAGTDVCRQLVPAATHAAAYNPKASMAPPIQVVGNDGVGGPACGQVHGGESAL